MVLNPSFNKVIPSGTPSLTSYDFIDISTGTGYRTYFGGAVASGAVTNYQLSDSEFYSDRITTIGHSAIGTGATSYGLMQDLDFDVQFRIPQVLEGTAIIVVPRAISLSSNQTSRTYDSYVYTKIRKWDGSTETEIAGASGSIMTAAGYDNQHQTAIKVVVPRTKFKKGDTLRVTAEHYLRFRNDNSDGSYAIGHDPKSRGYSTLPNDTEVNWASCASIMTATIPFKVDI